MVEGVFKSRAGISREPFVLDVRGGLSQWSRRGRPGDAQCLGESVRVQQFTGAIRGNRPEAG
ncbi:hypothetical protein GCM10010336_69750 [Streptomyces goshikiensis]|nr:hypothetical protein GCM10010336_69750 [Streptomyces goshikiensis]